MALLKFLKLWTFPNPHWENAKLEWGDRVSFNLEGSHSYAEKVVIDAARAIPLPDDISFEVAAAMTAQGMTAHYLMNEPRSVK